MNKLKIAIADDYPVFRDGLKAILSSSADIAVILEADNGAELLTKLESASPDIILMDLKMPVMGGMEATRLVRERYPAIKVLVISMYEDDVFISHLVKAGANGYLLKNAEPEDIRRAIYAVTENGYFFNEPIANGLLRELISKNNLLPTFNDALLSEADKNALQLLSNDPRNETVSPVQREQLMQKTGVRNTAGLIMYAMVKGLIEK